MGVTFLFGYTTLCSTALLFLYFTLTNRFAVHTDYEAFRSVHSIKDHPEYNVVEKSLCHPVDVSDKTHTKTTIKIHHEYPPRTETLEFLQIPNLSNGYNKARYQDNNVQCISPCANHAGKVIFVTNVIALGDEMHRPTLDFQDRKPTDIEISARWMEVLNTLQQNLKHKHIRSVVVLVEDTTVAKMLRKTDFQNSEKLIIQAFNGMLKMTDSFEYATRCFKNQVVVLGNQDVIFGSGWENLDIEYLQKTKSMYALTRHNSILNEYCYGNPSQGVCDIDYSWAHDAFVFHVKKHITHQHFPILSSKVFNVYGGENIVIWTFRNVFKYKVTNPCTLLHLHHEHCVPIRNKRNREGNKTVWATAEFTNTLY